MPPEPIASPTHGRRNLILLGFIAVVTAVATTAIELTIYRLSGDIYLDRSRPGYLPDEKEIEDETNVNTTYSYGDTGPLDPTELQTYLKELKSIQGNINKITSPYGPDPLSDESLGIGTEVDTEPEKDQK